MLKKLKNSLLAICLISLLTGCVNQNQGNDSKDITLAVTSVSCAQLLDKLNVPASQIVGICSTSEYKLPKKYSKITKIKNAMSPDMEKLSKLKPDLIISPNSLESELSTKYKKIKLNSAFLDLKSLSGMYKSIQQLGKLLNKEKQANKLVKEYKSFISEYRNKHVGKTRPRVLILMGLPVGSYVVASESSYAGNLVKLAGATNVYGDGNGTDFLNVSVEDMLKQNPDIILRTSHAMSDQVKEYFKQEFANNAAWSNFSAVTNNKVYDLDNNYFGMSANFNYQKGLESLEGILYGSN